MSITVWLLDIHHRHGNDVTTHSSEDTANGALFDYVAQCWPEVAGREYVVDGQTRVAPAEVPADADTAIDIYFEINGDESYTISSDLLGP